MKATSHAFNYLQQGFKLVQHRQMRGFIGWPIIINTALFLFVGVYVYNEITHWIASWISALPHGLAFLAGVIKLLIILFLMIAAMFSFAIMTTLITAPFYCLVAEKAAFILHHPTPDTPLTIEALSGLCWRSLGRELQKLLYYLPRTLLLLIISFIPVINIISPVLWGLWGAWLLSVQFVDYAADNDHVSALRCRQLLSQNKINTLLLGGMIMIGMLIPILNIVMGVVAVAAATVYWIDLHHSSLQPLSPPPASSGKQ